MAKTRPVISHHDFVRDLARGAVGEEVVERFIKKEYGLIAENVSEKNPDFDLIIRSVEPELLKGPKVVPEKLLKKMFKDSFGYARKKEVTVEVKLDEAAAKYGNLFFEAFFDVEAGNPGATFKCKADLVAWVVPSKDKSYKIYLFKRAEMLAWLFNFVLTHPKKLDYKTPAISPYTRGIIVPIREAIKGFACIGEFDFKL